MEMDFTKTDEQIAAALTTEENAILERFIKITTRIQILENFRKSIDTACNSLSALDEMFESTSIRDKYAFTHINKTISAAVAYIDTWLEELKTERSELLNKVSWLFYKIGLKEYIAELKIKTRIIEPSIPKYITKYFLTDKFGEGDSPAKDAMSDICTEVVNYFITSMNSGVFEKIMDDMRE